MTESPDNPFEDDLADIAAGDEAAVDRHLDLLSENEDARDLRHDVGLLAEGIKDLGGDYNHPADFDKDLVSALDKESAPESQSKSAPSAAASAAKPANANDDLKQPSAKRIAWGGGLLAAAAIALFATGQFAATDSSSDGVQAQAGDGMLGAKIVQIERTANDGIVGIDVIPGGC